MKKLIITFVILLSIIFVNLSRCDQPLQDKNSTSLDKNKESNTVPDIYSIEIAKKNGDIIFMTIDTRRDRFGDNKINSYEISEIIKQVKDNGVAYSVNIKNDGNMPLIFVPNQNRR